MLKKVMSNEVLKSLANLNCSGIESVGFDIVDNVFCRFKFVNIKLPLVVTFSNALEVIPSDKANQDALPWGFEFVSKYKVNVLSFASLDSSNWYRSIIFHKFLEEFSIYSRFKEIYGYGGSMGGYAVGAFNPILNFTRILLLNPISTLNENLAPWETRFAVARDSLNWKESYFDGASKGTPGYIVYDNLFDIDRLHATRYQGLTHLHLPGVGHAIPAHLSNLGVIKSLFEGFLDNNINHYVYYRQIRKRKLYPKYYEWLLSSQNRHLTEQRKSIIQRHFNALKGYMGQSFSSQSFDENFVFLLRDAAILLETTDELLSYKLMKVANELRPDGPLILKKLKQYKKNLNIN